MEQAETRRIATGAFYSFVSLGMTVVALGPALPYLAQNTGSSLGAISSLFVAQNVGYILGSFGSGRLYDRLPAGRLMAGAFLVMLPALVLIPFARALALLLALIGVLGLLQGAVDVGGNFLILQTPPESRGVRLNALHMFFGVGALLTPLAMRQAMRWSGGLGWGFRALALLMLAAAAWMLRLPALPRAGTKEDPGNARLQPLLVVLVVVSLFLVVGAEGAFGGWIYTYASHRGLADADKAFLMNSLFWLSLTMGRLAATLLASRVGSRSLVYGSLAGCLAAVAALLAWPSCAPVAWIGTAAFGFFIGPLVANLITLAGEVLPVTGHMTSFFVVGFSLGGIVVPWLIGQLIEPVGPAALPVVLLACLALACGLFQGFLAAVRRGRAAAIASRSR
jgi:MFS transporter, FHS family, Na+ dependent glucose transporter 1